MASRCTDDHNNPMTATWLQQQTGETRSDCRGCAPDSPAYVLAPRSSLTMVLLLHKCHIYTLDKDFIAFLKDARSALSIVTVNKRRHTAPNVILTRLMSNPLGSG